MESLKLLISAYACEPGKGSEPGVGWRWALECARLGHEVWVITRENNRPGIDAGLAAAGPGPASRLHFVYYDLPPRLRGWKRGARGVHLYYLLWQWGAYSLARRLHAQQQFDAVHHLTFGVMRQPSFMGRLGIPFVLGPVGGAERAPLALRRHFSLAGQFRDGLRDLVNLAARFDPLIRRMLAQAAVILVKTPETLAWLPNRYREKAQTMLEIGIDARAEGAAVGAAAAAPFRLLYVGRFVDLKGMELGLRAVALLRTRGVPVSLTLIGHGPEAGRWGRSAAALGLADCVSWVSWMNQDELFAAYGAFDAFLFPSLRDSSGNVVLEAMAGGLPVVCLGLGGPTQMVDASCGCVVPAARRNEDDVVAALAEALANLARDPAFAGRLRAGARLRAAEFAWRKVVGRVWSENGVGYLTVAALARRRLAFGHA